MKTTRIGLAPIAAAVLLFMAGWPALAVRPDEVLSDPAL
jgi:hypothetical protein